MTMIHRLRAHHDMVFGWVSARLAPDILPGLARLTLAGIFWRSLLTKVSTIKLFTYTELINDFPVERARMRVPELPLDLKPATLQQFRTDFALPLLPPEWAAWMATLAEFVIPIMLVLGLATRIGALALIGLTLVIQIFVFPEAWWSTHALWLVIALYLVFHGPGRVSLDHILRRNFAP